MKDHPYKALPREAFWRLSVSEPEIGDVDPVLGAPFTITPDMHVATAGSCFAQHIARYLRQSGFNFLVTEPAHPIVPANLVNDFNYGVYTARYGNVYTSRQLVQLFRRAYGAFVPNCEFWPGPEGRIIDPFRPQIQPNGFINRTEFRADRERHFSCVRQAFEKLDVFVFTLGLTECWMSVDDQAVYPLCPGVAGGTFDPNQYSFVNLSVQDVASDLVEFAGLLRSVNQKARIILTVSPVPLIATFTKSHVLVATNYSKSVLRVAAAQAEVAVPAITYFPSYEIITGSFNRGMYFAKDCRAVTEDGVRHVMRSFMRHFTSIEDVGTSKGKAALDLQSDSHTQIMQELVRVVCDEEAIAQD